MKLTALAVTALVAVASVASATEYQSALRALAADPTERQSPPCDAAAAAGKEPTAIVDAEGKNSKECWGGLGWGRPWGGFGGWGGYGGGWGWGWGW